MKPEIVAEHDVLYGSPTSTRRGLVPVYEEMKPYQPSRQVRRQMERQAQKQGGMGTE